MSSRLRGKRTISQLSQSSDDDNDEQQQYELEENVHRVHHLDRKSGKWSLSEENEANKLVIAFESGTLEDCQNGVTLRSYLARKLNCAPMRISKKFAGRCIGKLAFAKRSGILTSSQQMILNSIIPVLGRPRNINRRPRKNSKLSNAPPSVDCGDMMEEFEEDFSSSGNSSPSSHVFHEESSFDDADYDNMTFKIQNNKDNNSRSFSVSYYDSKAPQDLVLSSIPEIPLFHPLTTNDFFRMNDFDNDASSSLSLFSPSLMHEMIPSCIDNDEWHNDVLSCFCEIEDEV